MFRWLSVLTILASLVLLVFAITQPALTIEAKIDKSKLADAAVSALTDESDVQSRRMLYSISQFLGLDELEGHVDAYGKTRSIWGTVAELHGHGNTLVAVLIGLFSVVTPVTKSVLQLLGLLLMQKQTGLRLLHTSAMLGKWSMADVFVLALIIAFLGGNADGHYGHLIQMQAQLHSGFWLFAGFCLVSLLTGVVIHHQVQKRLRNTL